LNTHTEFSYGRVIEHISKTLNPINRDLALRTLKWLAFASRPLKFFELQDGIALYNSDTVINDYSKLSESVLDLCKPLIERSIRDTVVFVHFTVKE
jgi:hypothetical protein